MAYPGGTPESGQQPDSGYTLPTPASDYPTHPQDQGAGLAQPQGDLGQYQVNMPGAPIGEQQPMAGPTSGVPFAPPMSGAPYAPQPTGPQYGAVDPNAQYGAVDPNVQYGAVDPNAQYGAVPLQPPMSGVPYSGMPAPMPVPMSGVPMSGVPMSGMPMSGMPMGGPVPQPSGGSKVTTIVLAAFMVVFLVVAGVMTGLFISKSTALTDSKQTVSQRDKTIVDRDQQLDKLNKDLQQSKDDLDKTKTDLSGSQNQATELKRQKQVISHCLQLFAEASTAAAAGDNATYKAKVAEANTVCDEAEKYLD